MSNTESNKKQPAKKPNNSYSLLLQGLSDVTKTKKPQNSNSSKRTDSRGNNNSMSSNDNHSEQPSNTNNDKNDDIQDPDIPDRSYGDYFCKLCDSHMNSDAMWEAHITGKRHIKNVQKGDRDSKYEDLPDVESSVKYEMRNVKDPVVGLSYIHEIRRKEPDVPPIYNCFLCHASIATVPLVTEHVLTMKHRLNYIKENNPEEFQLLEATNLNKSHMEPLVLEAARAMEQKFGRGTVKVKQEKKKNPPPITYSAKRTFNLDEDDPKNPNYIKINSDKNKLPVWKSVDAGKSFGRQERSRSPRDFRDNFRKRSRSRSPRDFRGRNRQYSDDELSMDGYKRSFPRRDLSPRRDSYEKSRSFSKGDLSPKHDYRNFSTDKYPQSLSREDFLDLPPSSSRYELPSMRDASRYEHSSMRDASRYEHLSRYDHMSPRESVQKPFSSYDHQNPVSSRLPEENYLSSRERDRDIPSQPKSCEDILNNLLLLSSEECYKLFHLKLKLLPDIRSIGEMLALTRLISEAQKKLKSKLSEEFVSALIKYQKGDTTSNIIPGLDDAMSSSVTSRHLSDSTQKPSNAASFLNDIFKNVNYSSLGKTATPQDKSSFPYSSLPTSYASAINSQQAALTNTYRAPSASFQGPPANSYQGASTSSFANQAPYQTSNTNLPFSSGATSNYMSNIPGLNTPSTPSTQPSQVFNYSQYAPSSSAPPRNFPRNY